MNVPGKQFAWEVLSRSDPASATWLASGRGELTRLVFIAGGIDFTDTRHSFDAWPALKGDLESVPAKMFGSMPSIKHGDVMLAQSKATTVYAASLRILETRSPVRNHGRKISKQGDGVGSLVFFAHGSHFADEFDRRDYATGELWKNELPFFLALDMAGF